MTFLTPATSNTIRTAPPAITPEPSIDGLIIILQAPNLPTTRCDASRLIGKKLAELSLKKNITRIVFDRGPYLYHGRIKALADGAREGGLQF